MSSVPVKDEEYEKRRAALLEMLRREVNRRFAHYYEVMGKSNSN